MRLGRYQLVSRLATGGMAEVYLARAAGPGGFQKSLVVKRILPHLAAEPRFVEMFLSEARLAARLDHPNIVQIFDFGEEDGTWFLAMEYVEGLNLRVLSRSARAAGMQLPAASCARIISSACEGLAYAHERRDPATGEPLGLVHRDISPDNILLSRQGAVKVLDFGIAKAAGEGPRTQTGVVKGKLAYMPPEQLRGLKLDRRVDVYALGVVLYELLTGHRPFKTRTDAELARAILHEPPVPAEEYRPELPEELRRILEKALAKERKQRHEDCRALQAELERFILRTGEPRGPWRLSKLVEQVMGSAEEQPTIIEPTPRGRMSREPTPPPKARPEAEPSLASTEVMIRAEEPTRRERTPEPRPRAEPASTAPPRKQTVPPRAPRWNGRQVMGAGVALLLMLAASVALLLVR